jgi:C1A family cysteine protease
MGINQFTGITDAEFQKIYLYPINNPDQPEIDKTMIKSIKIDINIDWNTKGLVSPVKNQGQCGSCWAFSAVGVLESWALSKKESIILSEQQLVDCSSAYGNFGCNGGYNYKALAYVRDFGITT